MIEKLVNMKDSIKVVEKAFREYGLGRGHMPTKVYLDLPEYAGDFRAMPAYLERFKVSSLKWVNSHSQNKKFNLPAVMATIILSDPRNGFPLAVMDGTYATNLRTGAAGAVAAKYLAPKNSQVVSMVGCGAQAKTQLIALRQSFTIKEVRVWGHESGCVKAFMKAMKCAGQELIAASTIEECVRGSDIIVTTTPSRKPIVKLSWLNPKVHINAIGADAAGKQELESNILKEAKVVIDDWTQATHSGEINVPLKKKIISRYNIYGELGQIIAGKKKGRIIKDRLTVFDSTGLAIQDTAMAHLIYKSAIKNKVGKWIQMI